MSQAEVIDTQSTQSADVIDRDSCGMARATELIGDRWTMLILREALFGVTRFDDIQKSLGCPRTILSGRLKKLVEAGVLTRRAYKEPGQRTRSQYVLTMKGVDLALPMIALMQWGDKYCLNGAPAAEIVERRSGGACRVSLVNKNGAPVNVGETTLRKARNF
jgi:DNA-binding HxlR family transcriptional regulator